MENTNININEYIDLKIESILTTMPPKTDAEKILLHLIKRQAEALKTSVRQRDWFLSEYSESKGGSDDWMSISDQENKRLIEILK